MNQSLLNSIRWSSVVGQWNDRGSVVGRAVWSRCPWQQVWVGSLFRQNRKTSSNGNIFRVTGRLCGAFAGHRWVPLTKASHAELWCFFFDLGFEQMVESTIVRLVIWDAIALIITSLLWVCVYIITQLMPVKLVRVCNNNDNLVSNILATFNVY